MTTSHSVQTGQESQERIGFLKQDYLEGLTVTIKEQDKEHKISLFSNKKFFKTLRKQFKASHQREPVEFLRDIFHVNQLDLSPADLLKEVQKLFNKYFDSSDDHYYLNLSAERKLQCLQAINSGQLLASFIPVITDVMILIRTNMGRPITVPEQKDAIPEKEVIRELLNAYKQDGDEQASFFVFLPARTVICSALDGIHTALQKIETKKKPLPDSEKDSRADSLMENVIDQIMKMQVELQDTLRKIGKDSFPLDIQKEISDILISYSNTLQEANKGLIKKFGKPNARSQQIEALLAPLTAAQVFHDHVMSTPRTTLKGTLVKEISLKESSLSACFSETNVARVKKYMDKIKTVPPQPSLPRHTSVLAKTLAELGELRPRRKTP